MSLTNTFIERTTILEHIAIKMQKTIRYKWGENGNLKNHAVQ